MLIIAWELTAACNLSCRYCRASASHEPDQGELDTDEAKRFVESIAPLKPMLILSGGEPLLRPDLFQIIRLAVSLGIRVSLASNGTLITSGLAEEIADSGVSRVSISLDGADAAMHDHGRGQGSFERSIRGIENLRGRVDFQINFTVTQKNQSELIRIFDLAEKLGAAALHIFFLVPTGRGREEDVITPVRQEEMLRQIEGEMDRRTLEVQVTCAPQYARLKKPGHGRGSGGCLAGRRFVFVSRKGEVYPCGYLPLRVGSVREKNFIEIWENSPELQALREGRLKGKCGRCEFSRSCGGCRARAYALTGDYLQSDPSCRLEA
ncbi:MULTISPECIES: radical SAM/SPASM domain-containing protein [Methanothrix]|jgi:AdoMet-dependent heme synthase|uniref:Radical sam domain heme biosynthesis protein n=1 Tax=hydrocarbon metagenome TaxID=938273 RepID=A0A0W8F6A4_9ZZZZ|nr:MULTISPECIES: radical SAM protein [Methanothrix]NYT09362.1 radical SAM protein [Methanosarcinales archaeon]MDD3550933.1 radical SAM protein [Methanothrix soehngenii]MDY0411365.1 radical SAM protein [Methanothrix soehngenii]UEC40826.1 MAG: Radical SAM domain heme biosynthesis protein [Methanothrix sp.]HOI19708.1 radical SAM protein [Methanothrix soehngenii]